MIPRLHPRHDSELDLCYHQCSQKSRVIFPYLSFGEVHNQYFLVIQDFPDIKGRFFLADNISHQGTGKKFTHGDVRSGENH